MDAIFTVVHNIGCTYYDKQPEHYPITIPDDEFERFDYRLMQVNKYWNESEVGWFLELARKRGLEVYHKFNEYTFLLREEKKSATTTG